MQNNWIDISIAVMEDVTKWPTDPNFELKNFAAFEWGHPCDASMVSMSVHTGTHIDAPAHFINGADRIGKWSPEITIGPCRVVNIDHPGYITREELIELNIQAGERILFKTQNSATDWWHHPFNPEFVHFSEDAAAYIAEVKPACIGIDYVSVGGPENGPEVHRHILGAGVWIIESINLNHVEAGEYELIFMPVNLAMAEGAPGRALLRKI
ncbi:MAG: cyclase family protein [Cytophagaceae bacterium]|nr:cyclase family protein [Cytophagaceae bacterium]MDW8456264.1 cyclase family protein [Cytophagaceae bacterium]